jgi:hypothetical protein
VLEPLVVTLGDVFALALVTPADGVLPEASTPARSLLTVGGQAAAELPVISDRDATPHADPMGVADAFAAGLLAALAADAHPDAAAALGREMAARCGAVSGPLP